MKLNAESLTKLIEDLENIYGSKPAGGDSPMLSQIHGDAMDVLIATILSQATTDVSAKECFLELKRAYPTWGDATCAPEGEIAELIKPCGLGRQKASAIKRVLQATGGSLDHLREMDPQEAYSTLLKLPGVGPKTAACVMLFAFGQPFIPVDTHVRRVAIRLGLTPDGTNAPHVQRRLQEAVPPEIAGSLHVLLIHHGRKVCTARSPKCERCGLSGVCDYYLSSVVGSPGTRSLESPVDSTESSGSRTGSISGKAAMSLPQ